MTLSKVIQLFNENLSLTLDATNPVQDVAAERMAFGQRWMIKIRRRVTAHAEALHYPA